MRIPDRWNLWSQERQASLNAADSWLGLSGLFVLKPGENYVGSEPGVDVELPNGPAALGKIVWSEHLLTWMPNRGEAISLKTDINGLPTVCQVENLDFFVVDRDGQLAVRVRDRDWAKKRPFLNLEFFSYDPSWSVWAHWEKLEPAMQMDVTNMIGQNRQIEITRCAVFQLNDRSHRLLPMSLDVDDELWEAFFVFRDASSGKSTYGAGRFLKVSGQGSEFEIDFNFAFNPPCAFTPFAMCPLPPSENWLPFAIEAGEKKPPKD